MQNDVVILEFDNGDGSEVQIAPYLISSLATTVAELLARLSTIYDIERAGTFEFFIVAVERGSIRFGLRPKYKPIREGVSLASDIVGIMAWLSPIFIWVGSDLGFLHLAHGLPLPPESVLIQTSPTAVDDPNVRNMMEQLAKQAVASGAKNVTISFPDQNPYLISSDGSTAPTMFGRDGPKIDNPSIGLNDTLHFTGDLSEVSFNGEIKSLPVATILRQPAGQITVLVDWKSAEPMPDPTGSGRGMGYHVVGKIISFVDHGINKASRISPLERSLAGVLVVDQVQVLR